MKLCTDCKYCNKKDAYASGFWKCTKHMITNPVSGEPVQKKWIFCDSQRTMPMPMDILTGACGKRGRWFEPKENTDATLS